MVKMVMYFNLRSGVSEKDFVGLAKEFLAYLEGKVEGLGSGKIYRHYMIGANPRRYQMHTEVRDIGAWDRFAAFIKNDAKGAGLYQEWQRLVDMDTHFDEFISELPL